MRGKKRYIELTEAGRKALEKGFKTGKKATFRKRCHYLLLSDEKRSLEDISSIYKISRISIAKWFDRYEAEGIAGLHTAKGKGRPTILRIDNEKEVEQIEKFVEKSAQNLKPVLAQIKEHLGKELSKRTLQRFLKKKTGAGSDFVK